MVLLNTKLSANWLSVFYENSYDSFSIVFLSLYDCFFNNCPPEGLLLSSEIQGETYLLFCQLMGLLTYPTSVSSDIMGKFLLLLD